MSREPRGLRRRRRQRVAAIRAAGDVVAQATGEIYKNEYAMNKYGRHRRAVIVGVGGPSGGISSSPANAIAYQIRNALRRPPLAPVILYDAAGAKIGTINPLTRERTVEPGATRSTT